MSRIFLIFLIAGISLSLQQCKNNDSADAGQAEAEIEDIQANQELPPERASGITFFKGSWEEALAEAKKQNKPVFLDAYADWCRPCKEMDRDVFSQQRVGDFYNENFINVKLDIEEGEGKELSDKYKVMEIPTYLYFKPDGELKHRTIGKKTVDMFIADGQKALES